MIKLISDVNNIRLDQYLAEIYLEHSRSFIQKMIKENEILVNDASVKTGYLLKEDDVITINFTEAKPLDLTPVNLNLDIIYEDDDLVVVNKPKGLVVHPASSYHEPTLVHGLLHQINNLSSINGILRPGIVHRLDKDTSGLMIVCKNDISHKQISEDLANRKVTRHYIAICYGNLKHSKGIIEAPIGRDANNRLQMAIDKNGRYALTHFEVLQALDNYTLVKLMLKTGRTHQIRVHMKYINHPVLGDPIYGPKNVYGDSGQYLHAYHLAFTHPTTKKEMVFDLPLPNDFKMFIESNLSQAL